MRLDLQTPTRSANKQSVFYDVIIFFIFIQSYLCEQECNANRADNLTADERKETVAYKKNWKQVSFCLRARACLF